MTEIRTHDVVVFGATGYTGRLVCEYLRDRDHGRRDELIDRLRTHAGVRFDVVDAAEL